LIKKLKEEFHERIDIFCAGSDFDPKVFGLERLITFVGMRPYLENGQMYKEIDIGVSLMASSHPSYPPIEMMACGVAVVTNFNYQTKWMFEGDHCLTPNGDPLSIYQCIRKLIIEDEYREEVGNRAALEIKKRFSDWESASRDFTRLLGIN
jgi:glycosyltransferase involved in cell wall biosynthesis